MAEGEDNMEVGEGKREEDIRGEETRKTEEREEEGNKEE